MRCHVIGSSLDANPALVPGLGQQRLVSPSPGSRKPLRPFFGCLTAPPATLQSSSRGCTHSAHFYNQPNTEQRNPNTNPTPSSANQMAPAPEKLVFRQVRYAGYAGRRKSSSQKVVREPTHPPFTSTLRAAHCSCSTLPPPPTRTCWAAPERRC